MMIVSSSTHEVLRADSLRAGYGKVDVLQGVTVHAEAGRVVTVIGPNGAGKSTLLASLIGVLPCRGQVSFGGKQVNKLPVEDRVLRGMALVPEKRELFGSMSVEDNLRLGAFRLIRLRQGEGAKDLDRVYELFPRLKERRHQLAATLSGGERQMLAIGRALMGRPSLLMLDEPSLGLAPLIVQEVFRIVRHLGDDGVTILLVEQNVRAALDIADYGYVMELGVITLEGPASSLSHNTHITDAYLGRDKSNDAASGSVGMASPSVR